MADWGRVETVQDNSVPSVFDWLDRDQTSLRELLFWHPPADVLDQIFPGFVLPIRCYTGPGGVRRFSPVKYMTPIPGKKQLSADFSPNAAWAGGLALHCRDSRLDAEQRSVYRMMWLIFRRLGRLNQHLGRRFHHAKDLFVTGNDQFEDGEKADSLLETMVVPDDFCKEIKGDSYKAKRPSVTLLKEKGKSIAQQQGISQPTVPECFQFGFHACANISPLEAKDGDVPGLIRRALFDTDPEAKAVDSEMRGRFWVRFADALENHLNGSNEEFCDWF